MPTFASDEQRVRRLAHRADLRLSILRTRSPYYDDARYIVTDPHTSDVLLTSEYGIDLDGAEQLIRERTE